MYSLVKTAELATCCLCETPLNHINSEIIQAVCSGLGGVNKLVHFGGLVEKGNTNINSCETMY